MTTTRLALSIALVAGLAAAAPAWAQPSTPSSAGATAGSAGPSFRTTGDARRDTIIRMSRRMSLEVTDSRLEDIMTFIKEFTQADLEVVWQGESDSSPGLDKDKRLTLNIKDRPALAVLEAVLEKAKTDFGSGNTWQMTPYGAMQVGPKEALNKERRVETYDINDLLTVIPRYTEVPEIDLNSVLQQSQGGGGGQSPFQDMNDNRDQDTRPRADRAREIIDILISNVEPDQWTDNGGEAATIRFYGSTLIVNAPDYVHRQINGYPYWPSYTVASGAKGRRYLTLNADTGASKLDGFANSPVTAIVGGRPISSNPGGGGGGLKAPPGGGGGSAAPGGGKK